MGPTTGEDCTFIYNMYNLILDMELTNFLFHRACMVICKDPKLI